MYEKYDNCVEDIISAQNGNKEDLEKLIEANKGLIWSIVKRFKDRGHEIDDLYQVAVMGFIKCIKKFDANFEVRLSTYAVPYILGEVKRYIRDDGPVKVSRSIKELAVKVLEIQKENERKNGKELKIEEIAKILKVDKEEVVLAIDAYKPVESIYENVQGEDDESLSIINKLSTNIDEETRITNKILLEQVLNHLKENERQVILLRYYRGKTQTQVAKALGMTQVQVSRMEKRVLESMKLKLAI